ncbi:hypothetical protein B0T26DRAFT_724017 [Lasiosphaeria miniovina]|uniref:Uncharacterized protein n=1 Tax=Lasiosphaeria miniovina TaxID=1954250 RepID=A0AA40A6D2_9PEZI|nr:uncharacterized protein B0T26DRAFT_724017 [Lasiosphaeria miniovina]KAK0710084.1 hypothetical protein B0T26DRAFT_724017 [Lasiosphaeria miniovina]
MDPQHSAQATTQNGKSFHMSSDPSRGSGPSTARLPSHSQQARDSGSKPKLSISETYCRVNKATVRTLEGFYSPPALTIPGQTQSTVRLIDNNSDSTLSGQTKMDESHPKAAAPISLPELRTNRPKPSARFKDGGLRIWSDDDDSSANPEASDQNPKASDKEIISITMANPNRPYTMWPDPTGTLTDTCGTLIPDGYTLDEMVEDRQWICPIRSCRRLYSSRRYLGGHFTMHHLDCHLNDNLDGTFSILPPVSTSTKKHALPKVVSRDPLNQESLASPKVPVHPKGRRITWISVTPDATTPDAVEPEEPETSSLSPGESPHGKDIVKWIPPPIQTNQHSNDEARVQQPKQAAKHLDGKASVKPAAASMQATTVVRPELVDREADLWTYLCCCVGRILPIPGNENMRCLLSHPRVRDIHQNLQQGRLRDLDIKQLMALAIQATGTEVKRACTHCRRKGGTWDICVNAPPGVDLRETLSTSCRCCANCLLNAIPSQCSVKNVSKGLLVSVSDQRSRRPRRPDATVYDEEGEDEISQLLPDATEDENDGDNEYDGMLLRRSKRRASREGMGPPTKRKAAALMTPSRRREARSSMNANAKTRRELRRASKADSSQSLVTLPVRVPVISQDVLEMEDWETGAGRIADKAQTNVAFSTAYLSTNQVVRVADNVTFLTAIVASGTTHRFTADAGKIRVCTVAKGKVRVEVAGEPQFTVGPRGMFRINRGTACSVQNWCYVDAILQVTAVKQP